MIYIARALALLFVFGSLIAVSRLHWHEGIYLLIVSKIFYDIGAKS